MAIVGMSSEVIVATVFSSNVLKKVADIHEEAHKMIFHLL
jgi:hypothetical protein